MQHSFVIVEERKAEFEQAMAMLVRRANRYGSSNIAWSFGEAATKSVVYNDHFVNVPGITVHVSGDAPIVGSYEFLASIDLVDGLNIVRARPDLGDDVLDRRFFERSTECEHCNRERQRNEVFVVRHTETGEQLRVGRSCLRDFLGTDTPEKVASIFRFFAHIRELNDDRNTIKCYKF